MGHGGWKTPFSVRFGGSAHEAVEENYNRIRANNGDAFADEEDSAIDAETQAQARLLARIDAKLRNYVEQSDPRALSTLLSRWEAVLGIQPSRNDSDSERRARVASRLLTTYSATTDGIDSLARAAFYPWTTRVHYTDADDAVMYWPGGNSHPDYDWYSTVAHIVIEYVKPAYASRDAAEARWALCLKALDEFAPAWTTFDFTETQPTGTFAGVIGFYLDQPNLDVSVL